MKKDRLDELLGHALNKDEETRDVGQAGLQRFRREVAGSGGQITVLDSLLSRALSTSETPISMATADTGMRRLRERLDRRALRRRSPVLAPALAFATVAVIVVALVIANPLTTTVPGEQPIMIAKPGSFDGALKTRNDILAKLPRADSEPAVPTPEAGSRVSTQMGRENRRIDSLDAFSSRVRGESFAKRIGGNRRTILASLSSGGSLLAGDDREKSTSDPLSGAHSRKQVLLNEKLNRVSEGF